ncbi:UDP-N-acetylmuramoyl-L-alanine--D-glutamate ligase [Gordonia jinhuaensis]|uniref:UDP-N-acetylmuramoylalanine--D-glutamate ligase n=1 Tax=Gordonia jinhuaensis TaxID=1517702 RepID=A0A916SXZ1_9ACTN|nr:UDP-N-acetylmuramoyl-L-alanine--D-glutamate ligase [Gordonia jinhuaensis]GGB19274.1 UDP-N-acetylmuramoylalanine--D-glutamate ligase [Gordonia jinhuaensis]
MTDPRPDDLADPDTTALTGAALTDEALTSGALAASRTVVFGGGVAGLSAARFFRDIGGHVRVVEDREATARAVAEQGIATLGTAELSATADWTSGVDLVITSPGLRPTHPLLRAAAQAGVPVWGEVELAWRIDRAGVLGPPRTWLVITGTNGKTTTTSMTEAIMSQVAETVACGNIGLPPLDALRREPRVEVLAVEASSFQLYWAPSVRPAAGVVLNIAEDHLDWHQTMAGYTAAKARALTGDVAIIGADDEAAAALAAASPAPTVVRLCSDRPRDGEIGVIDGVIVDRAFDDGGEPVPLVATEKIRPAGPPGLHDALAAAALARAAGASASAVEAGLAGFHPGAHRGQVVAVVDGVSFLDDSKATNPHAALASILAHPRSVLVAGGQLKGAAVDELIVSTRDRVAAAVVLGVDRQEILDALARHAPEVPTVTVFTGDDGRVIVSSAQDHPSATDAAAVTRVSIDVATPPESSPDAVMAAAVTAADRLARLDGENPVVLLAPAAASLDMFSGYGHRGDSFARAAAALHERRS